MVSRWTLLLYPELLHVEPARRAGVLASAGEGRFDLVELAGMALALVLAVVATRYAIPEGIQHRFAAAVVNFAVALPLLAVLVGPFHVRRVRRGLRGQLADTRE